MSSENCARAVRRDIESTGEDNRDWRQGPWQDRGVEIASSGMSQAKPADVDRHKFTARLY